MANLANRPQFAKLKPSKLVLTINNLLADVLIQQTFFRQMLETSEFTKLSPCQTFPLYGIALSNIFGYSAELMRKPSLIEAHSNQQATQLHV